MKKRWLWLLMALVLLGALCVPGAAGAAKDEPIRAPYSFYIGWGETIQPDYPDLSLKIGEGLTQDDFIITYSSKGEQVKVDPTTGEATALTEYRWEGEDIYITYTPVKEGVGKKTVFSCRATANEPLTYIKPRKTELLYGLGEWDGFTVDLNTSRVPGVEFKGYDSNVITVKMDRKDELCSFVQFWITPVGVGETTITIYGYNGVSADVHVKVMKPPTKLSFARDVFHCYEGEEIDLGIDIGGDDCAPRFEDIEFGYSIGVGDFSFKGGVMGLFCPEDPVDYYIYAITYNDYRAETVVKVYDKESAVSLKANMDVIRAGDENVKINAYDANGNPVRAMKFAVTKGQDIARMVENQLITTGPGEIEVTCTNYDGTTCSETFEIVVMPTKIILNATEVTLEIGETFEVEVGFDQGELPYEWWGGGHTGEIVQYLYPTRKEGNVIIAQAPGTETYIVRAGNLQESITVTVPDSDKAVHIVCPLEPFPVGESFQFYVCDKTGKVYPATFSSRDSTDYGTISASGYFTAKMDGYFDVSADLADGRHLGTSIQVEIIPKWLQQNAIVLRKSETFVLSYVMSDRGPVDDIDLTFEVADESVLIMDGCVIRPKKIGKTTVLARSKYDPTVSTTFTVEVISDTTEIFIGTTSMRVPYGSARPMPVVYDNQGREVEMVWKITHDNPGEGNPEKSGFTIKDGIISCTWPTASCEVTGTVKRGSKKVKVTVKGYTLPETMYIEPEQVWLEPGETQKLTLMTEDEHGGWGVSYWEAEKDGIVTMEPYVEKQSNTITAVGSGKTLVAAVLENGAIAMCIVNVYDPNERLPGDVNEDGAVDAKDALIIMQYSAGWPVLINGWQGDVNADGSTTLQDALLIFQHASGMDVELMQYIPAE